MADFGVAGSAVGVISLGIQVCQGLLQYYGTWKDGRNDISRMCKLVGSLADILKALKQTLENNALVGDDANAVQSTIRDCTDSIAELQQELAKVLEIKGTSIRSKLHEQGRRLLYPFRESTLLKLKEIVSDIRDNLNLAVETLHLETAFRSADQLEHLSTKIDDMGSDVAKLGDDIGVLNQSLDHHHRNCEAEAIIDWLSPLNFFHKQNDTLVRRQEGTGEWLFETSEYKDWQSGKEKTLWCWGLPGAGKTILASAIIDRLETEFKVNLEIGIAFIYCNYKEHDSQTLTNLLGSLVKQLVQKRNAIYNDLSALYAHHDSRKTRPSHAEYSKLLRSIGCTFSRLYVVVDALDECNANNGARRELIRELRDLGPHLHLLCTSRRLGDIEQVFETSSSLEIQATDTDVRTFLEAHISHDSSLAAFCARDKFLQTTIIEKLIEKAKGMFLLAQLHLRSLSMKTTLKQVRRALDKLPEELDQTYEEAMERIQKQHKDRSKLALRLLTWITYALRPLTIDEIQHALAVMDLEPEENDLDETGEDFPDTGLLITVCEGLVAIDTESHLIRLIHYTAQEYFDRRREEIFPKAQINISLACIRYLSLDPFLRGPFDAYYAKKKRYKLLSYASHSWFNHARGEPEEAIKGEVQKFLSHRTLLYSAVIFMSTFLEPSSGRRIHSLPEDIPGIVFASRFRLGTIVNVMLQAGDSVDDKGHDSKTALHWATENGDWRIVQLLLEANADVNNTYSEGRTALHDAASNGDLEIVKILLKSEADINAKDSIQRTPFHDAAKQGHELVTELLIQAGAVINAEDIYGWTALNLAADGGRKEVIKLLIEAGADTNIANNAGFTPLYGAVKHDREDILQMLLQAGADPNGPGFGRNETVLYEASVNGKEADVRLLLGYDADVNAGAEDSLRTPLHGAALMGHKDVVLLLLEAGADVSAEDFQGQRALSRAAMEGHDAIVQQLLEASAEVDAADSNGRTALHEATRFRHQRVIKLLLEANADINAKDTRGRTALSWAAMLGYTAIVEQLLQAGAEVNATNNEGQTILAYVTNYTGRQTEILIGAIEARNNSNTSKEQMALYLAAKEGCTKVERLLLDRGAIL